MIVAQLHQVHLGTKRAGGFFRDASHRLFRLLSACVKGLRRDNEWGGEVVSWSGELEQHKKLKM